jgi:high-affinity iron transporter
MLSTLVIVFREILEVALILGVVMAATRGAPNRNSLVLWGVVAGVLGSLFVAYGASEITDMMEGMGQEILNIAILSLAVLMIGLTVIWVGSHSRKITAELRQVGQQVVTGEKPLYIISIIVATSVLREGTEITLFLYGIIASGASVAEVISGFILGLILGATTGLLIYNGLLSISQKYVFTVTTWLLVLLAAGMAAKVASFLDAAELLTYFSEPIWDSSWLISESSIAGKILGTLVGYMEQPTGMQAIFYISTLLIIFTFLYVPQSKHKAL